MVGFILQHVVIVQTCSVCRVHFETFYASVKPLWGFLEHVSCWPILSSILLLIVYQISFQVECNMLLILYCSSFSCYQSCGSHS